MSDKLLYIVVGGMMLLAFVGGVWITVNNMNECLDQGFSTLYCVTTLMK